MSVIKQIVKELEQVKDLSTLHKEITLLIALRRSAEVEEQKTVVNNLSAYLATK